MAVVAEGRAMAKVKAGRGRPEKPAGEPVQVRIDADLVPKAKYLAAQGGLSMTDYLSGLLRPILERDFRKAGRSLLESTDPEGPKG